MTKVINGKYYNTETAIEVCDKIYQHSGSTLYRTRKGNYFFYHWNNYGGCYRSIEPCTVSEAKEFMAEHATGNEYIKEFGEVEEA